MPAKRPFGTVRSLALASALLSTTALTVPAFAQIETVIVTAQKRAEDVQSVPISITAYSAKDLAAHQVQQFKDLQFSTPNVSYTKGNFTGANFQIRGIGVTAVGFDAESGVAVHFDDVYLSAPPLAEGTFYDLSGIDVLRGPQSTLYGRGATGGTVNILSNKPNLDEYHADAEASYGNYDYKEVKAMANIPIIEGKLGLRLAGDWLDRGGTVNNVFNGDNIDDRGVYSYRGTLRWQPSEHTTIDLIGSTSREDDNRMRSQKQYCSSDPTGTLGCLPDSISNGLVNLNSTLGTIASSVQGIESAGLPGALGLFDLTKSPSIPPQCLAPGNPCNPADRRSVDTDFNPTYHAKDTFAALNVKQSLSDWLDATVVVGYDKNSVSSQESYNNVAGEPFDQTTLGTAEATLLGTLAFLGGPDYAALYAPYFTSHPGELPVSGIGKNGLTGGNIAKYSSTATSFDQSNGESQQWSGELRFNSNLEGPVNFLVAGYYLSTKTSGDYYVNSNLLDYPSLILGSFLGLTNPACYAKGCTYGPGYYRNNGVENTLDSKAIFGEVYYQATDDLKFTGGMRWTEDTKFQQGRIELLDGVMPIGQTSEDQALAGLVNSNQYDFDCSNGSTGDAAKGHCGPNQPDGPNDLFQVNRVTFDKITGRFVADWNPKIDFTDATHLYASYSRGYKAGGFNPGIQPGLDVQFSYKPESIDAYEVGAKNNLLDNTLQANMDVFYYDYKNLQVSAIENNTSVNQNINSKVWGAEGEFNYVPDDHWAFNLNVGTTQSSIQNSELVDDRNPTGGRSDVVLIKDATLGNNIGQNCVLYLINGQTLTPADNPAFQAVVPGVFFAPPGGSSALAAHGVAHTNYGTCAQLPFSPKQLGAFGYSESDPTGHGNSAGAFVSLNGNELQNTPKYTISLGGQYTQPLDGGYKVTLRVDYYWQAKMFGRIFNDPADSIKAWDVTNALVTFTAPEDKYYVQGFVQNIFDKANMTGLYLTSSTSGLYTNAFIGDPRMYGIRIGAHF